MLKVENRISKSFVQKQNKEGFLLGPRVVEKQENPSNFILHLLPPLGT